MQFLTFIQLFNSLLIYLLVEKKIKNKYKYLSVKKKKRLLEFLIMCY